MAVMITDSGYAMLDKQSVMAPTRHSDDDPEEEERDVPASRVALWMMGRDEFGRSTCIWLHHLLPYFYVGISHSDSEWARVRAPLYAKSLRSYLECKAQQESSWRKRPQVLEVRVVKRRWFYGYRPDPSGDHRPPRWVLDPNDDDTARWDGSTTQASDWYLKVCAGAPFQVNKLRSWASEWSTKVAETLDQHHDEEHKWQVPVVRTTSTVMAPVNLCVFEANVEFSLRCMIDRGLVGCGWCVVHRSMVGKLDSGIRRDNQGRSRCQESYVVDARVFERAERDRDRALNQGRDPQEALRLGLVDAPIRFVARESDLQCYVDGKGAYTTHPDPMEAWFEDLRQSTAPLTIMSFDIECCNPWGSFPKPEEEESQVINIAARVYRLDRVEAYERGQQQEPVDGNPRRCKWPPPLDAVAMGIGEREPMDQGGMDGYSVRSFSFEDERSFLLAFAAQLRAWDPDIIEGYNSVAFDMAYLLIRAKTLGIEQEFWELGRLVGFLSKPEIQEFGNKAKGKRLEYRAHLHGRVQFDLLRVCVDDIALKLRSYTLNNVSYQLLNEGKKDMDYKLIPSYHARGPDGRRILDEYCDADAVLPFKIERHQSYLMRYIELARVTGVPMRFLLEKGQQVLVFAQLLRKGRQENYAIPWLPVVEPEQTLTESRKNKAYEGAVVIDPCVGFYTIHETGPVVVNDYNSLYPSSMISQNLGYTTHVTDPVASALCRQQHKQLRDLHDRDMQEREDQWYDGDLKVRSYETQGGWKVAPVDSDKRADPVFVRQEVRKSLLAQILEALLAARGVAKKLMKQYPKGSPPYKVQDARQMALKVCANSVYGFTGAPVGRQPDLDVSGATTGYGRKALHFAQRLSEQLLPGDNQVVYGDTDSVMVCIKDACTSEASEPGKPLSQTAIQAVAKAFQRGALLDEAINSRVLPPMRIETEKVYAPFLLLGRKKYLTLMWMKPDGPFGIDAKGIEMVRRDNPHIVGLACTAFADLLMGKGPKVEGKSDQVVGIWPDLETAKEFLRDVHARMLEDDLPFEAYVISAKYSKPADEYETIPPHVALAMRMQHRDEGSAPKLGDRIPYVIVRPEFSEPVQKHEKSVLYKDKRGVKVRDCSEDPQWAYQHKMQVDNEVYATKKFEPPFLRMLAPILAKEELQSGVPKDPRIWTQQNRRHRDHSEKLEEWIQKKRQANAEAVVYQAVFADNYRSHKIRRTAHPDCAIERAFKRAEEKEEEEEAGDPRELVEALDMRGAEDRMMELLGDIRKQSQQKVENRIVAPQPKGQRQTSITHFFKM